MKRCAFLGVGLTVLVTSAPPAWAADEGPERLCVYYFGNSLTGNTMPTFHPALGKSAGREWVMDRSQGAGWQRADGLDFGYTDRGRTDSITTPVRYFARWVSAPTARSSPFSPSRGGSGDPPRGK